MHRQTVTTENIWSSGPADLPLVCSFKTENMSQNEKWILSQLLSRIAGQTILNSIAFSKLHLVILQTYDYEL